MKSKLADRLFCATLTCCLLLSAASLPVRAASVSLVPLTPFTNLANGDIVRFDVAIDFSGVGTLGGGFDIIWDPLALGFVGLVDNGLGDPAFRRDPDVFAGLLESWAVGDFDGLAASGPEIVGSASFEVLPTMGFNTFIQIAATSGVGGPWVSAEDNVTLLNPVHNSILLERADPAVIPLPAAAWLFGSALLGLVGWQRRRATSS